MSWQNIKDKVWFFFNKRRILDNEIIIKNVTKLYTEYQENVSKAIIEQAEKIKVLEKRINYLTKQIKTKSYKNNKNKGAM